MESGAAVREPEPSLEVLDWGVVAYDDALRRQEALVSERVAQRSSDRLVLVEHPPVVTVGRSGGVEDLRASEESLRRRGIAVHFVDRGGRATFHGPGQLVAYPIVKLRERDLHLYLERLLETLCAVIRSYGLSPQLRPGNPGVWVGSAKVASVGIAVRRWVAYHGVALNVTTDPTWFDWIVPCGNAAETITSLEREAGRSVPLDEVKARFVEAFRGAFGYGEEHGRHPPWLVRRAPSEDEIRRMEARLRHSGLATVCESAHCPNLGECFGRGTATFLILGNRCTRACRFCAVEKGVPEPPDPGEPARLAATVQELGLGHVVVTSVTRDDLPDGGASHFARTIEALRQARPGARVEVLIPDFQGSAEALGAVFSARPDVLNHNVETVARLYTRVRPQGNYRRSLEVLKRAARAGLRVKSGLMLGLGESEGEVLAALEDLRRVGCTDLTLGQYLAPSKGHLPVSRYVPPDEFDEWADVARSLEFEAVASGPLVRSSYRAGELWGKGRTAA
ncbi:MAG: lipoyl synthase [Deltaproteobacteria bacterium]|nr:lipoyl synthase [Deltaproteobacteria bacterium]